MVITDPLPPGIGPTVLRPSPNSLSMLPTHSPRRRTVAGNFLAILALGALSETARAQWAVETYELKAGWNAIWLPMDCSHGEIPAVLTEASVEQVWRWNPPLSTTQFTVSPQTPLSGDVQWSVWE